jgi:hypothetical protein
MEPRLRDITSINRANTKTSLKHNLKEMLGEASHLKSGDLDSLGITMGEKAEL